MGSLLRRGLLAIAVLWLPACGGSPSSRPTSPDFVLRSPANGSIGVAGTPTFVWDASSGTASYTVQVSQDSGFVSVVVNQSGVTGTALEPAVTLDPGKTYFWRVMAERPSGDLLAEGSPWSFSTVAPVPGSFTMLAPASGTIGVSLTPTFSWTSSVGAASYHLEISTESGFESVAVDEPGLASTSLTLKSPLASSKVYFWRVLAVSTSDTTASGAPWIFTTETAPPGTFTLVSPVDPTVMVSTLPTYQWTASTSAESYQLQVSTDSFFTHLVVDQSGITTTSFTPTQMLLPFTNYTWRVLAVNGSDTTLGTPASATFLTD